MLCHRSVQQGNRINSMYLFYLHSLRVEQPTMIANPGQNAFLLQHKMNETIMCRCKHNALPLAHLNIICEKKQIMLIKSNMTSDAQKTYAVNSDPDKI